MMWIAWEAKTLAIRVLVQPLPPSLVVEPGLGANSEPSCSISGQLDPVLAPPANELGIYRLQSLK